MVYINHESHIYKYTVIKNTLMLSTSFIVTKKKLQFLSIYSIKIIHVWNMTWALSRYASIRYVTLILRESGMPNNSLVTGTNWLFLMKITHCICYTHLNVDYFYQFHYIMPSIFEMFLKPYFQYYHVPFPLSSWWNWPHLLKALQRPNEMKKSW